MKRTSSGFKIHRTWLISLVVFFAIAALLALAVSAKRARQVASLSANVVAGPPRQIPYLMPLSRTPKTKSHSLLRLR